MCESETCIGVPERVLKGKIENRIFTCHLHRKTSVLGHFWTQNTIGPFFVSKKSFQKSFEICFALVGRTTS